jgi:hypothetical protein
MKEKIIMFLLKKFSKPFVFITVQKVNSDGETISLRLIKNLNDSELNKLLSDTLNNLPNVAIDAKK